MRARSALEDTDQRLAQQAAARTTLQSQREQSARDLVRARRGLAQALRAAYLNRQSGPVPLLLDQSDPLAGQRLLTYYGYLSRAGAARVTAMQAELSRLQGIDATLERQQDSLQGLRQLQQAELLQLAQARSRRQGVLASLTLRVQTRGAQLAQLQHERDAVEQLVQTLGRHSPRAAEPEALTGAFARLRGELSWPVSGQVLARFGQQRGGGVAWDGILIGTQRDTPVRAVSAGRVAYADWLPGLGLLMILDHGDGYLSLYAHNDRLYRPVGATVQAGQVIAASGDTGGRAQPQLLFEIRRAGKPIDPQPWFSSPRPPP